MVGRVAGRWEYGADPEEVEEAIEVAMVGVRIEVGDARGEFGGQEETSSLFGADLLACARQGWLK